MTPAAECTRRVAALREALAARGLEGALILQAVDVLWLSGTRQNAALWLPVEGEPALLVRKSLERARAESPLARVLPFPPSRELAGAWSAPRGGSASPSTWCRWRCSSSGRRALPGVEWTDVSMVVRELRSVKSTVGARRGCATRPALLSGVIARGAVLPPPRLREVDVAAELEVRMRRAGNEGSPRVRGFNQEFFMGLAIAGGAATAPELLRRAGHRPRPLGLVAAGRLGRSPSAATRRCSSTTPPSSAATSPT